MPLISSFISSGPSSIVKYLRGFYCEPQNEGPESPSFSLVDSSLSLSLSLSLFLISPCFLSLLFIPASSVLMAELNTHLNCFEISLLPFADFLRWYILISTVCWHSLSAVCWSLHSWHNLSAFACTLRHTLKQVISPKLYSSFHIPVSNTRNTKTTLKSSIHTSTEEDHVYCI